MHVLEPTLTRRAALRAGMAAAVVRAWPAAAQTAGAARVALVIGNAAYAGAPLPNAANDAKAMSATLAGMGFRVVEARDAGKAQMEQAIAQARALLQGREGIGLLYYAGHGLQLDWRNYLLPVDAQPASAADVPRLAVDIQAVIDAFKDAGNRMNIVVLDACRNNPFGASASGKGLAPLDAPPGTFLAYATAPGNVAEDGSAQDGNGLYTGFLLKELQRPESRIEDVFKRVRLQVRKASKGRQVPWESTSLEDDFVFSSGARAPELPRPERDAAFKLEAAAWAEVRATRNPDELYAYLQQYPGGWFAEQAQFRLDRLQTPAALPQTDPQVGPQLAPGANRWALGDTLVWQQVDRSTGRVTRIEESVTALDGERVIINGGEIIRDQMGAQHKSRLGRFDPPLMLEPASMAVGKRWRSAFQLHLDQGGLWKGFVEARVAALEDIELPAGRFRAFRVDIRGDALRDGQAATIAETQWVDPATLHRLRHDVQWRLDGKLADPMSSQLLSMKLERPGAASRPRAPQREGY